VEKPVPFSRRQVLLGTLIGILSTVAFLTCFILIPEGVQALIKRIRGKGQLNASAQAPKEVAGFYPYWNLSKVGEVDLTNLSTVYYFAVHLRRDGTFNDNEPGISGLNSDNGRLLKEKVLQNGARWGVTIVNLSANSITRNINNPARQQTIVYETIKLMKQEGFTALNIDFEYLGRRGNTRKESFTSFAQKLTDSVHREIPGSTVSFDAFADSAKKPRIIDINSLGEILDYVIVMGYDFHSIASRVAGPVAPLTGKERYGYDVTSSVSDYLSKVPPQKLLLGVPFYGYDWPTQNDEKGSVVVSSPQGPKVSCYARSIETAQKNNSSINFDDESKSVWFSYFDKQHHTWRQVWFENEKSLGLKFDLVNRTNLGGIAIFALGYDSKEAKPLWDEVRLKLKTP
jgi:spore germination protein YaaH